jgi:hypothetical protein
MKKQLKHMTVLRSTVIGCVILPESRTLQFLQVKSLINRGIPLSNAGQGIPLFVFT